MSKVLMSISVKGKSGAEYGFLFYGEKKYLQDWEEEGFEILVIDNYVPHYIVQLGLIRPFVFMQDIFNFKNPFSKKDKTGIIDVKNEH